MSAVAIPVELRRGRFVPMQSTDLERVLAVEVGVYPFPWTQVNFAQSIAAGYSCWMVLDDADALLAYAVFMLVLDEAHLLNLTVAPAYQGQGYGRALLDFIAHQARSYRAGSLLLEVRPSNHRALHIYQRYGFAAIGTRRGYYPAHNTREDAIVMRVAL